MIGCCLDNCGLIEIEQVIDEFIGMQCFEIELIQGVDWEVFEIKGDDHTRASTNSGSENVAIISVRQLKTFHERLEISDQAVWHGAIHQVGCAIQFGSG